MTRVHLHNVTLAPASTLGRAVELLIKSQLVLDVLADDQLVTRSEPSSWSEAKKSWLFEFEIDIPESSSNLRINIRESVLDQYSNLTFDSTSITLENIVSASEDYQHASLERIITTSADPVFQLRAEFTILELLVYPLDYITVIKMCITMFQEDSSFNLHDLAILYKAVMDLDAGNSFRASFLHLIGDRYKGHYQKSHHIETLEKTIEAYKQSLQASLSNDEGTRYWLSDYGNSLFERYKRLGKLTDLNDSIAKYEEAARLTPDGHPHKLAVLNDLGASLGARFESLGELTDLEELIDKNRMVVKLTPDGHPAKPAGLNNLGASMQIRFEIIGELDDLEEAIANLRAAVQLSPDRHPSNPSLLNNLGDSLATRFQRLGELEDLEESIFRIREAVRLTPDDHPDKPLLLNHLGSSLFFRFRRLANLSDLDECILKYREGVRLTPDGHPSKPSLLNNLGSSLQVRFEQVEELNDLEESITSCQAAVRLIPDAHPDKPSLMNNLGMSLQTRFERLGEFEDLEESIAKNREAVRLTPDGHPDKPSRLADLGSSLASRYFQLKPNDIRDLKEASSILRLAVCAEYGSPSKRFAAAPLWAYVIYTLHRSDDISTDFLEPYRIGIPLVSELAWLGSSMSDRHHQVRRTSDFVQEAVSAAFKAGEHTLAIEWLEQARSVAWSQYLQLRTPFDELDDAEPELGRKLRSNSTQLENSLSERHLSTMNNPSKTSVQDLVQRNHQLVRERKDILTAIRKRPGFERFLLPKQIEELRAAASNGPVVVLTSSKLYNLCCALILLPGLSNGVTAINLESFPPSKAERLYKWLKRLLHARGRNSSFKDSLAPASVSERSHFYEMEKAKESIREFIIGFGDDDSGSDSNEDEEFNAGHTLVTILAELWHGIAKPVLDALTITNPSQEHDFRIWWCPTGIFSFLPLHAAGLYQKGSPHGSKLSDYVISSYAPTLSTLLGETTRASQHSPKPHLLAIAQSSSSNQRFLPGTLKEIQYIEDAINGFLPVTSLVGEHATRERVISELKTSDWVHFAGHGVQDTEHSTESAVLLANADRLSLADISILHLPRGGLAFLSACQTAKGDENLSDEAVHLGAGMLVAGYKGVIATMWSVGDDVAPQVAREVYKHLIKSGADSSEAARALHLAIQKLRESNESTDDESLLSWVPFIHLGR